LKKNKANKNMTGCINEKTIKEGAAKIWLVYHGDT
jgi:hypothetical protein